MHTGNRGFRNNKKVSNNVQVQKETLLDKINNNSVLKLLRDNISLVSICISGITIFIAVISYNYRLGEMDYWNISSENLSFSLEQNIYDVFQFVLIAILVFFVNLGGFLILKGGEESIEKKDGITFIDAEIIYIFTTINTVLWVYLNTRVMLQGIDMPPQNIRYYIFFVLINFVVNVASNILVNKSLAISKFKIDNSEGQRGTESELKQDNLKCKKLVFLIRFVLMIVYAHASLKIFECFNIKVFLIDVELVWGWYLMLFGFLHFSLIFICIMKPILDKLGVNRVDRIIFVALSVLVMLIILPYIFYSDGINQQKNKKEFLVIKEIDNTPISKQIVLYEGKDFYIVGQYRLFNGNQDKIIVNNKTSSYISKENVTTQKIWFDSVYTEKSFRDEQIEKEKREKEKRENDRIEADKQRVRQYKKERLKKDFSKRLESYPKIEDLYKNSKLLYYKSQN